MYISKSLSNILVLAIILIGLLGYNFISAGTWTAPTATPPSNNVATPINVGTSTASLQDGLGTLVFNRFAADNEVMSNEVWSNKYCDRNGLNCVTSLQGRVSSSCPVGQSIRVINADGSVTCQSTTATSTPAISCTTTYTTTSGCYYGSGSPVCPVGWTRSGPSYGGSNCSTNNNTWYTPCIRTVCS